MSIKYSFLCIILFLSSCKQFLEIAPPKSSLINETVFQGDEQATSAILGIYTHMASNGFAAGGSASITVLAGLSSDDLMGYNSLLPFYENELTPELLVVESLYSNIYKSVYSLNSALEGLSASTGVTPGVKRQLEGEALLTRAFCYFYLVNTFGPVPLQLSADYRITQSNYRSPVDKIYEQIMADLLLSVELLADQYPSSGRVRPNKSVANALLARVYLYLKDYANAEKYATRVIAQQETYDMVDLNNVFLADSREAIWQLLPAANSNALDGNIFILNTMPTFVSLSDDLATQSFELNDKRKLAWIKSLTSGALVYYYPYKYKVKSATGTTEYSMILRLAEQYLIRAEARAYSDQILGAVEDLDKVRDRAGITLISDINPSINKGEFLDILFKERRVELFSEWGHRWYDLNRTQKTEIIMKQVKPKWQLTDVLYPIPANELTRNRNISQNQGY